MTEIDIPAEDKSKLSTRIDTLSHDIVSKICVEKYGSKSHMSAVVTDALKYVYDPTPTQLVAQQKFLDSRDLYPRDQEGTQTKVLHWSGPSDLVELVQDKSSSNREVIESAIYDYESAYSEMEGNFSVQSDSEEGVVDWDFMENNYSVSNSWGDVEGAEVPRKPNKRRPFVLSLLNDDGISSFKAFNKLYYNIAEDDFDVSGLPKRETRKKDWEALIEEKHLIPTPAKKSDIPINAIESDTEAYYKRNNLGTLEEILTEYLDQMNAEIETKAEAGVTYKQDDAVFNRKENTLSIISSYEIPELQLYVDRANKLQNKLVEELVEFPN